jgi:hypothetical protein
MTGFVVEGNDKDGAAVTRNVPVLVGGVDGSGNVQTFLVGTDGSLTLTSGDIEIGAVELKNATDDTRAKIAALSGLAASDVGLGVTDPVANAVLGVTTGTKVITDANGTLQQYLRGLIALLVAATADAAASTAVPAAATMAYNGATWDRLRAPNVFKTVSDTAITAGTPLAIWTPTTGKKFRMLGFTFSSTIAGNLIFKDATTEFFRAAKNATNGISTLGSPSNTGFGYLSTTANNVLNLDVSATTNVSGTVWGCEE